MSIKIEIISDNLARFKLNVDVSPVHLIGRGNNIAQYNKVVISLDEWETMSECLLKKGIKGKKDISIMGWNYVKRDINWFPDNNIYEEIENELKNIETLMKYSDDSIIKLNK